jgi:flagella basal body P-ring formation protein FlgA
MTHYLSTFFALATLCLIPIRVFAQDTITLKPAARVASMDSITIGDIATLSGSEALKVKDIPLATLPHADQTQSISLSRVREAIEAQAAARSINIGRIILSGRDCRISVEDLAPAPAPESKARPVDNFASAAANPADAATVRAMILAKVIETAAAPVEDVRISFERRDADLLDKATSGRVASIAQSGAGEKLTFNVRLYEQNMLIKQADIRVGVLVRRSVALASLPLTRGDTISPKDYRIQEQWLPLTSIPASTDSLDGSEVRSRINTGELIETRDVQDPLAVRKGDRITVDSISGGIVLSTSAIALAPGRSGDIIDAKTVEWQQPISVKISNSGHAVSLGPTELKNDRNRSSSRNVKNKGN